MIMRKTLFVLGLLLFLMPFLGFTARVDMIIYIILGILVMLIALSNKQGYLTENPVEEKKINNEVFEDKDPKDEELVLKETIDLHKIGDDNQELLDAKEKETE